MAVRRRPSREAPGQHFLRSSRLASELVRDADVSPRDLVVDVGAGTGAITAALLRAGARVLALELDEELAEGLRRRFADAPVTVVTVDARAWALPDEPFAVVSNLPFSGAGDILGRLLHDPRLPLRQADVVVQWELAQKHASVWPATLRGVYWRAWFEVGIASRLSRTAFSPPPRVDAAVLRIARRRRPPVRPDDHECYWRFLAAAFSRNATLELALRPWLTPRELRRLAAAHGFHERARPRDLDARQWVGIFAFAQERGRGRLRSTRGAARARSRFPGQGPSVG